MMDEYVRIHTHMCIYIYIYVCMSNVDINIIRSRNDWRLDRGLRLIFVILRKRRKKRFVQLSHVRKTNPRRGELAGKINEFAIH